MTDEHDPLFDLIQAERAAVEAPEVAKSATLERLQASIEAGVVPPVDVAPSAVSGVLGGSKLVWWLGAVLFVATITAIATWVSAPSEVVEAQPPSVAAGSAASATIAVATPDLEPNVEPDLEPNVEPERQLEPPPAPPPKRKTAKEAPPRPVEPEPPPDAEKGPGLEEELALMRGAQRLMTADRPKLALEVLERHRRRFASGVLREEREALAIMALCRLGRGADAESRMVAFEHAYPKSPQTERIRSECLPGAP